MSTIEALITPPTPTAARALEVVSKWASPAMVNHCLRSWVWAERLAATLDIQYDTELLFVAAMLHDLGVAPRFDALTEPFEDAGAAVAWSFAAGANWPPARRTRLEEVIQKHAWPSVECDADPEGFLLEAATSLDVAGSGAERWDDALLTEVATTIPRLNFSEEFGASMDQQAVRKPTSEAARFSAGRGVDRGEKFWTERLR